jgi:hypothetical protein
MIQKSLTAFTHEIAQELTLAQFYDQIRFNNHHAFLLLRNPTGDVFWEEEKKKLKKSLPVVWLNANLDGKGMSKENVSNLTGLMFFDLDKLCHPSDQDQLLNAKEVISEIDFVSAVWVSPSGTGVHLIASVNLKHLSVANFEQGWEYTQNKIIERVGNLGGEWDPRCKNVNRKTFISKDPHIWVRNIVTELDIPKAILTERKAVQRGVIGSGKIYDTTKAYDRLHERIIHPNEDFMTQLLADHVDPEGAQPLFGLDGLERVGFWYEEPLIVPYLFIGMSKIAEGNRNYLLCTHIAYWLYLNRPYVNEEGLWKYAKVLHSRCVQTGEYATPEPIYKLLVYMYNNFNPNKLNIEEMKKKKAFFYARADLSGTDKMLISLQKMGIAMDVHAKEKAIKIVLREIQDMHELMDTFPPKAKINIKHVHERLEKVFQKLGGTKMALRTFYDFCNASPEILQKLQEVNANRFFTYSAALKWAEFETIHNLQPDRFVNDLVTDVVSAHADNKTTPRSYYYRLKGLNDRHTNN